MYKTINKESLYYGSQVILMVTKNPETKQTNITPISSSWTLNKSIVLGLGLNQQGYINLKAGSNLTLNLADASIWKNIEKIAKTTGNNQMPSWKKRKNYQFCSNKFVLGKFTPIQTQGESIPRIAECPIQIEANVIDIFERTDYAIIECESKQIFVKDSLLGKNEKIKVDQWRPLIYKFRTYTTTQNSFGENFRFEEDY